MIYSTLRWHLTLKDISSIIFLEDFIKITYKQGGTVSILKSYRLGDGHITYDTEDFYTAYTNLLKAWEEFENTTKGGKENGSNS